MLRAIFKGLGVLMLVWAFGSLGSFSPAQAKGTLNYTELADEIGGCFKDSLALYRKGDLDGAKKQVQGAYFHVFENLEGPIRINVSARKNAELEDAFVEIRKMVVAREPVEAIEARMNEFMAELRKVIPELESGSELVAEAGEPAPERSAPDSAGPEADRTPAAWRQAADNIKARLAKALDAYKGGDATGAAEQVVQTQFDDYKNSLLEIAIRRNISQKKAAENNAGFAEVAGLIRSGAAPAQVEAQMNALVRAVQIDLPGLPLVEGVADRTAASADAPEKDWAKVNAELFAAMDHALALYRKGETKGAAELVQDSYFDVFEGSGMEAKIGARDAAFKSRLEGHFSLLIGQARQGAPVAALEATLAAMKADFSKAAELLGKGRNSPAALFFYSLMIIVREGVEAILIITAIIAYLVKAGHRDKLGVIHNGCISALVLSFITAILLKLIFKASAATQEVMEGGAMLLASVVLFGTSYWLVSKAEAQKWLAFIKDKVGDSVSKNALRSLWFAAFLAVYREGAETVLFYQALAVDAGSRSGLAAVAGGFVLGSLLLVGIYFAMRSGALRLPIRPFFICTGALLYYMAFVFAGDGVMELIEGKVFQPSLIAWMPTVRFIGLYPYAQTLIPQLLIVLAALVALVVVARRGLRHRQAVRT